MNNSNYSTPIHSCIKSVSKKFTVMDLLDPRSPTTAFQRTPIQFSLTNQTDSMDEITACDDSKTAPSSSSCSFISLLSPEMNRDESLELSATSSSYISLDNVMDIESFNLTSEDLSIIVSDCSMLEEEVEEVKTGSSFSGKTDSVESSTLKQISEPVFPMQISGTSPIPSQPIDSTNSDDSSSNKPSTEDESLIKKQLKKQFFTPNPSKKRNPLGLVDNICPTTPPSHFSYSSPQGVIREKQWKRIQEERKKLGLESDENILLPLFDVTASAPCKLMLRKMKRQGQFRIHS